MENIGFYARLGLEPGRLTITVSIDAARDGVSLLGWGPLAWSERAGFLETARELLDEVQAGFDYAREITLTADLGLG
jgi:hypothetical protein